MTNTYISATEARNRWFELLNLVYFKGESVIIEKNSLPMVKMSSVANPSLIATKDVIKKTFGFLKKKKTYWPVLDEKIRNKEIDYLNKIKSWTA